MVSWMSEWKKRYEGWWLGLAPADASALERCTAFLSGALVGRFSVWMALKRLTGGASAPPPARADAGCEDAFERVEESLPEFPELTEGADRNEFQEWRFPVIPIPQLVPRELISGAVPKWEWDDDHFAHVAARHKQQVDDAYELGGAWPSDGGAPLPALDASGGAGGQLSSAPAAARDTASRRGDTASRPVRAETANTETANTGSTQGIVPAFVGGTIGAVAGTLIVTVAWRWRGRSSRPYAPSIRAHMSR